MTNKKEVAQSIWDAFYSTFADERVDFTVQKLNNTALANVLREVANQLQYHNFGEGVDMIVDAHSLYEVADELEVL
jgi:hypothetical protein